MEPTITKRLHISGLTPSISQQDLSQRLSTFGNLKSLDGLGLLDATGQPKKFAYATLEATPAKLSKCINTLSGTIWKGAKLRLGEAKPDFRERIKAENEKAALQPPPKKKSRWKFAPYHARHAKDMTPVTLETAKLKGGWVVTPLGRIHRPLRMRPLRPLPPPSLSSSSTAANVVKKKKNVKGKGLVERKRMKKFDTRARRRKIDMTKYGSVYIKGRFLDVDLPAGVGRRGIVKDVRMRSEEEKDEEDDEDEEKSDDEDGEEEEEEEESEDEDEDMAEENVDKNNEDQLTISTTPSKTLIKTLPPNTILNLDLETKQSFNILTSLFGNDDDDDWIGRESPGSDIDETDLLQQETHTTQSNEYEIVPRDGGRVEINKQPTHMEVDEESQVQTDKAEKKQEVTSQDVKAIVQSPTNLKDLFAPTETQGEFSLLSHLNLDIDIDLDDVPFPTTHKVDVIDLANEPTPTTIPTTAPNQKQSQSTSQITLDPSKPLFFPLTLLASHPSASSTSFLSNPNAKNRPKDLFDTLQARGLDWRSSGFYRTQSEDEIRQRWEEQKVELTHGWKKRWREAGKFGRRRGRSGGDGRAWDP